ncbi:S1 family peptidase [Rhizobium redzepovicii]|uniref:S1 family peptidase n=1 Tax=Rhizobium redzepovicii TaxID=2867518 RepID=UPI0028714DD3|nr:trypsin-like serine protease [Rhizobium redzepovicii]MDR9781130.1 trypsin-like serine protease [Rhizobium redzepovicii]
MARVGNAFQPFKYLHAVLIAISLGLASVANAADLKGGFDHAKEENRRILNEIVDQAQEALRTLEKPEDARDARAVRNRRERSQPRIVNGRGTIDYPSVGAVLKGSDARSAIAWCSGTLIAADKILTAAHCIAKDPRPNQYKIFLQSAGFVDVKAIDWQEDLYEFPKADVAILHLAAPVLRVMPEAILANERPIHGTLGTIVGFGRTGALNEDYGLKREGFIETAPCPAMIKGAPLVCWNFSVEVQNGTIRSNTCNADSGGPLFVYEVVGGRQFRRIAGVTSGGEAEDCLLGDQSYDADVAEYSKWISEKAHLLGEPASAGEGPVLVTERDVSGETSKLTEARSEITYPLDVREGIETLMVAMNGDDNGRGRNNFDLYVVRATAGAESVVCSEEEPGQFAFCRFENPDPGAWKVVVKRKKGEGAVQVVVTQLPTVVQ